MKIFVIRHGQTEWNKQKVMQGQTDIPLNEEGIMQAQETGKKLKGLEFDAIYCSPLLRTRQTLENLNLPTNKAIFDDRLKERNYGEFEKTPKSSFDYDLFWNYGANKLYKQAENVQQFFSRVSSFIEELKMKYLEGEKKILVVTHAGVTKVFKWFFDGLKNEEIGPYLPSNAEILTYEI